MKKIINTLMMAVAALSMQSCLHDDNEVFDMSASERIAQSVEETRALLQSSPNGWQVNYYLGEDYSGGGVAMLMRFDEQKVYVSCETFPADSVSSSTWTIKQDAGVVISVDTYNEILHSFSDPSASYLDGQEGDYEFIVQRATEDSIYVKGKKWKNKMVLTRVDQSTDWADFLTRTSESYDGLALFYETSGGTELCFDWNTHLVYLNGDYSVGYSFCGTPGGVEFAPALELDGKQVATMALDKSTRSLQCDELGTVAAKQKPLADLLIDGVWGGPWYVTVDNMSKLAKTYFTYMQSGMNSYGFQLGFVSLGVYFSDKWALNLGLVSGGYVYSTYVEYTTENVDGNTLKLTGGTFDEIGNAEYVYKYLYGSYVIDMLGRNTKTTTWKLSTDDPLRPGYIELQNASRSAQSFRVVAGQQLYPFE